MPINVTKNNKTLEPLDITKLEKSIEWATTGAPNTSASDILMKMNIHFYDGIPTATILDLSIKTADEMSTLRNPNYDKVAANLFMQKIYHQVFGSIKPSEFHRILFKNVHVHKKYRRELLLNISKEELVELGDYIDYSRNFSFSHAGLQYLYDKYAVKHNGLPIEDPQTMYMAIAIDIFSDYPTDKLLYIKQAYDALSTFRISLPTPEMVALRTNSTAYASCCLIDIGDSIESWNKGFNAIVSHTCSSAGCGVNTSAIASIGDKVKSGSISHGGKIKIFKAIDALIQTSTQNNRRGSAMVNINFFDPEILQIFALKSPRTDINKRINDLKYAIKFNKFFYDLVRNNGTIHFYSTRAVPGLDEAFNSKDQALFAKLYTSNTTKAAASIGARDFFSQFIETRFENGVYYVVNIDTMNNNTPYKEPIRMTNICLEDIVPTKPLTGTPDSNIGICVLTNINQGLVPIVDLPHYTNLVVRIQNAIIHRQNHPTEEANQFVHNYRSIGIGFSNHAYWLAKQNLKYGSDKALALLDEWAEHFQYGLMRASCDLAKELTPAPYFKRTSYFNGIMPYDRQDNYTSRSTSPNWLSLCNDVVTHGMYNTSLSMLPPGATSTVISNQTASINPIRQLLTIKDSKTGNIKQFAPEASTIGHQYEFAFESKNMTSRFMQHVAVIQKWVDMGISADTYYNPELYSDKKVPARVLAEDILQAHELGVKTVYYNNVYVEGADEQPEACTGTGCAI